MTLASDSVDRPGLDEAALVELAKRLAPVAAQGLVIHLQGDLGTGKTTFARALLQALGIGERVKSPTYSLIESYPLTNNRAHHLDLYRLADPEEVEWLGLPDLADPDALILIEWPERGGEHIPPADLRIELSHAATQRNLRAVGLSRLGTDALKRWSDS
ncbi:MAG: tRNA (adenosine(37)-N6)-threonylcarbamoyltransferase complex ATPase subunit type 1 TsaE [Dokdonella sp.]